MGSSHDPDNYRANSEHRRQTCNAGTIRLKQVKNMTLGLLEELKPENKPLSATLQQMERYKILTENLHAWFGSNHVLKDISIKIRENEATAIIGPFGCGKSTLIRCLNRMHELVPGARSTGRVVLDDSNIYAKGVDPVTVRRRVGMVFQKPNPFPTMSVYDNVAAGLKLNGVRDNTTLDQAVESSLERAFLWDEVKADLDKPGVGLSGGQQQRLCIARALAVKPEVLLMDEPCSALDPVATLRIEELIGELKDKVTIAIVTHNMQQAARVADTTAFMLAGEVIEVDETDKMFTNPNDERTEQYVTGKFG